MFFVGLQYVVLEVGEQRADLGIHHLVLDVGVHGEQFDDLPGDLFFLLDRPVTGGLELPEQVADFLVIGLQHDDGIR
jgi:hypothetical protein